jgi:hypothetical protein
MNPEENKDVLRTILTTLQSRSGTHPKTSLPVIGTDAATERKSPRLNALLRAYRYILAQTSTKEKTDT